MPAPVFRLRCAARSILHAAQRRKIDAGRRNAVGTQALASVVMTCTIGWVFTFFAFTTPFTNVRFYEALTNNKAPMMVAVLEIIKSLGYTDFFRKLPVAVS